MVAIEISSNRIEKTEVSNPIRSVTIQLSLIGEVLSYLTNENFDAKSRQEEFLMTPNLRFLFLFRRIIFIGTLGTVLVLAVDAVPAIAGIIVGITPTSPSSLPSGPFSGDSGIGTNPPNMVQITGDGTVTSNPADVWNKDVVWNFAGDAIDPNDNLCISEEILLNSSPTSTAHVTDWHERITDIVGTSQPFGWTLEGASISLKVGASPQPIPYNVGMSGDGHEIWFEFPPINIGPPGSTPVTLVIGKYIQYLGTQTIDSGGGPGQIQFHITEQPSVPEPGSFVLIAVSAVWFVFMRRRPGR